MLLLSMEALSVNDSAMLALSLHGASLASRANADTIGGCGLALAVRAGVAVAGCAMLDGVAADGGSRSAPVAKNNCTVSTGYRDIHCDRVRHSDESCSNRRAEIPTIHASSDWLRPWQKGSNTRNRRVTCQRAEYQATDSTEQNSITTTRAWQHACDGSHYARALLLEERGAELCGRCKRRICSLPSSDRLRWRIVQWRGDMLRWRSGSVPSS